jgi:hypothetical protein
VTEKERFTANCANWSSKDWLVFDNEELYCCFGPTNEASAISKAIELNNENEKKDEISVLKERITSLLVADTKNKRRIAELEEELFKQSQESKEDVSRAIEIILIKDAKIAELEKVLALVKKDLLMRAEEDSNGCKVVDLSSSIWIKLTEALKKQGDE